MTPIPDEELLEIDSDTRFLRNHYAELLDKFNEEFVAVKDQDVVAHNKDLAKLKEQLMKEGVDSNRALIEFIRDKRNLLS